MSEDHFFLPLPLSQQDQEFLSLICTEDYRFPSVFHFVNAARILDFWPDKKTLIAFEDIFMAQDFGIWDDEEEELELPPGIFFHLYQIVSTTFPQKFKESACPIQRDMISKFVNYGRNFLDHGVRNEKMAFLLCFCKNFNLKRIFGWFDDWRSESIFYFGKIAKRNPNISLVMSEIPACVFYKSENEKDCIYKRFEESFDESFTEEPESPVAPEISYEEFTSILHPWLFQWNKVKELSFWGNFYYFQELKYFLRFFGSIPRLDIEFSRVWMDIFCFSPSEIFFSNLESLNTIFHCNSARTVKVLERKIRFSPKLKFLKFQNFQFHLPMDWLISSCSEVEFLSIEVIGESEKEALDLLKSLSSLQRLQSLEIGLKGSMKFVNCTLNYISLFLPHLKSLEITFITWPDGLKKVENCHFSNLEYFSFDIWNEKEGINFFELFIENLKMIKSLRYSSDTRLPDDFFSKLSLLECLDIVNYRSPESFDASFLSSPDQHLKSLRIDQLASFDCLSELRKLNIYSTSPNLFREIVKLTMLEELTIFRTFGKNDPFDFDSISQLSKLKKIHLRIYDSHWETKGIPSKGESLRTVTWSSGFDTLDDVIVGYSSVGVEVFRIF